MAMQHPPQLHIRELVLISACSTIACADLPPTGTCAADEAIDGIASRAVPGVR